MTQYLYLIQCQNFYKIGVANDVQSRLAQLSTGNPFELKLLITYGFGNASAVETAIHQRFDSTRKRGEWFELNTEDLISFSNICQLLGGIPSEKVQTVAKEDEIEEAERVDVSLENVRTELRMSNGEPRGVVLLERGSQKKVVAYIGKNDENFEKYLGMYKQEHPNSKALGGALE